MKLSKKTLEQIKTKVDKLVANGETKDHAISIICDRNDLNPQDVKNQLGVTTEEKPSKYKDIKNSEGSYVMLKKNPQKQYEVININNKDTIILRDLNDNSEIKVSEEEIIPVITETKMSEKLNEAQYTVSIDNLETTDAETLSQMLSLAGQAEEPAVEDVPSMEEPATEPVADEVPPMVEPEAEIPAMEPEDVEVPAVDEEIPSEEIPAPVVDDTFGMEDYEQYPVEESKEEKEEDRELTPDEIEEAENFLKDIAADKETYPDAESMTEALRSLQSEGMITSKQYDYCQEHWDEIVGEEEALDPAETEEKEMITEEEPAIVEEDTESELTEEEIDEQIKESLKLAGIELEEASGDAQMGVRDEPVVAVKPKADPTDKKQDDKEPGENQRPETAEHEIESITGAEGSQQGQPCPCNIVVKEMVSKDKIQAICETAKRMYAKKDQKDWLALDRRYVEKLIREGVCYSNASKMLLKAKAGK